MIQIRNRYLPFKGFKAMMLRGVLLVREPYILNKIEINHEKIHVRQWLETIFIGFYFLYILNFIINAIWYLDFKKAYREIAFEREAASTVGSNTPCLYVGIWVNTI